MLTFICSHYRLSAGYSRPASYSVHFLERLQKLEAKLAHWSGVLGAAA